MEPLLSFSWSQESAICACSSVNRLFQIFISYFTKTYSSSSSSSSSSIGTTTLSWVSACSTVVEHSQQEGFTECRCQRHVKPQPGGEPGI
jgi:hypothetical protein